MSNPILSVQPANASGSSIGSTITNIPAPTSYSWTVEDLSADGAGRVESMRMLKKRIGKAIVLELEWTMLTYSQASIVLNAFDPEYLLINYLDARTGNYRTRHFYVGSRGAPLKSTHLGRWDKVAFNVIQATPDPG